MTTTTDLTQQIRDRLDGLGPERGVAIEFPATITPEQVERFRKAYIAAAAAPWTMQEAGGPKVYPGFEMMRDAVLAVLQLHRPPEGSLLVDPWCEHCDGNHERVLYPCPTIVAVAEKLGIEAADA